MHGRSFLSKRMFLQLTEQCAQAVSMFFLPKSFLCRHNQSAFVVSCAHKDICGGDLSRQYEKCLSGMGMSS